MAYKTDANQSDIVRDVNSIPGYEARNTAMVKNGFPDIVVGGYNRRTGRHETLLVEIKTKRGKLTPDEYEFFQTWPGAAIVANTARTIFEFFGWTDEEIREAFPHLYRDEVDDNADPQQTTGKRDARRRKTRR